MSSSQPESSITREWNKGHFIMKRGASSLVIAPEHVQKLMGADNFQDFSEVFLKEALQNRSARRVFEAWERKEKNLLESIHKDFKTEN